MAWVTQDLIDVWKSGLYVGENTPMAVVQLQLGHWQRGWYTEAEVAFPPVSAQIWGEGGFGSKDPQAGHWGAKWVGVTAWIDLPNLSSIKRTRDFSQKGITVCEIILDAQDFVPKTGALGDAYHVIAPGWLSATRNYVSPGRPDPGWETNEWAPDGEQGRILDGVKVRVWQGYGQPQTVTGDCPPIDGGTNGAWTFAGMIDDIDLDGDPNTITVTARNGKLLSDQRVFRASKSVQLKDPITFYDRLAATQLSLRGSAAKASTEASGFPAANVIDFPANSWDPNGPAYKTMWQSADSIDAGGGGAGLAWVEVHLPQGQYDELWLQCPEEGLLAYIGIYARPIRHHVRDPAHHDRLTLETEPATMDGAAIPEGWVNLHAIDDLYPDGFPVSDWPYVRAFRTGTTLPERFPGLDRASLGHSFELGEHSILRLGFVRTRTPTGQPVQVGDLHGMQRVVQKEILHQQFILVDDASECVKVVLRWAGFQQWDVEEALVRLSDGTNYGPGVVAKSSGRLAFNRQQYLADIIEEIAKQLGYIFFIADPTDANSDGVPTFRRDSSLLKDNKYIAANVTEDTMLTGLKVKHTDAERPYIIRVRGKTASVRGGGVPLGGDSITRVMATYLPPWSRPTDTRIGGVLRHIVYEDDQLVTYAMCLYGCFLIALNAAAAMHTAVAEIPAHPILELDDQVAVIDEPTGTNSRLWLVKTEDTMTLGQSASWKQTLEGSLLDTDDMAAVLAQVTGHAPFTIGNPSGPPFEQTIEKIDWRHVKNPDTGRVSGYIEPVLNNTSRTPRIR